MVANRFWRDLKMTSISQPGIAISEVAVVCGCKKGVELRAKLRSLVLVGGEVDGGCHGVKEGELIGA